MADVSKETEKKINQLQLLEQSMQNLSMQKQQFQLQQVEIESALKELDNVRIKDKKHGETGKPVKRKGIRITKRST